MKTDDWKQVTCCPRCGGSLVISEYYSYTRDYKITRKGILSKRFSISEGGGIGCFTAFCNQCEAYWDGDSVFIESDNTVWLKEENKE